MNLYEITQEALYLSTLLETDIFDVGNSIFLISALKFNSDSLFTVRRRNKLVVQ